MRTNFGTEDPAPGWMDDQHCGYPRFLSFSRYIGDYATPLPVILGITFVETEATICLIDKGIINFKLGPTSYNDLLRSIDDR